MNKEPARSFYTRGSMIHKGLEKISRTPLADAEWRTQTKKISLDRFYMYVINPLKKDGFVVNRDGFWRITKEGENRLSELGAIIVSTPERKPKLEPHAFFLYDGAELKAKPSRENAEDFLKYPSRMNNRLYYRDGRVEVMA
jgi:hypothetical protein